MALVDCPDCDTQMSDKAIQGPECGYYVGSYRPFWHWLVLGVALTFLAALAYSFHNAYVADGNTVRCTVDQVSTVECVRE